MEVSAVPESEKAWKFVRGATREEIKMLSEEQQVTLIIRLREKIQELMLECDDLYNSDPRNRG